MTTTEEKKLTDEQVKKDDVRFAELNAKAEKSEEENKELGVLKEKHSKRVQDRINKEVRRRKEEEEARLAAEEKVNKLERELEETRKQTPPAKTAIKEETIEIAGKRFYTDEALASMVDAGEITNTEAYKYQRKRDKTELKWEIKQEERQEKQKEEDKNSRINDAKSVLEKYPHFAKSHPDFNPADPLYKLTQEIYAEGYIANPRGLSKAVDRASQILGLNKKSVDRSDDFSIEGNTPSPNKRRQKDPTLTDSEQDTAITIWTKKTNPATGREYTEKEALVKGLAAKKRRLGL